MMKENQLSLFVVIGFTSLVAVLLPLQMIRRPMWWSVGDRQIRYHQPARVVTKKIPAVIAPVEKKKTGSMVIVKGMKLNSVNQDYTYYFTGSANCGRKGCTGSEVKVSVEGLNSVAVEKTATIDDDGTYQIAVAFKEMPGNQIDWKLQIRNEMNNRSREYIGRNILMDHRAIQVTQDLSLS